MTVTTDQYVALIAPLHAGKPKFATTVALSVDPLSRMQAALRKLIADFDLDTAVGPQLDAVGVRVGRARLVPYPLQGLFFTWGDPSRGWGTGIWKGPYDAGSSIYQLDDATYRRLLYAKVLSNVWDGTIAMMEAIYRVFFNDPATLVFVSDDAYAVRPSAAGPAVPEVATVDMKATVGFAGKTPSIINLAILNEGLVGPKPAGVATKLAVTSVDGAPLFGFGVQNAFISGWGSGSWAATPAALLG